MSITIGGVLTRDAEHRTVGTNDAVVVLTISIGDGRHKFEARVFFGKTPEDHLNARAAAGRLKRGEEAVVVARGLRWCDDHGEQRFLVTLVQRARVGAYQMAPA